MLSEDRVHFHVYGISNCDSCRTALKWLGTRNVAHTFHDFRKEGLSGKLLRSWLASSHSPYLINRRSTTWRQLSDEQKMAAETNPASLLQENLTLIKRPVITNGEMILDVGFSPSKLEDSI